MRTTTRNQNTKLRQVGQLNTMGSDTRGSPFEVGQMRALPVLCLFNNCNKNDTCQFVVSLWLNQLRSIFKYC